MTNKVKIHSIFEREMWYVVISMAEFNLFVVVLFFFFFFQVVVVLGCLAIKSLVSEARRLVSFNNEQRILVMVITSSTIMEQAPC